MQTLIPETDGRCVPAPLALDSACSCFAPIGVALSRHWAGSEYTRGPLPVPLVEAESSGHICGKEQCVECWGVFTRLLRVCFLPSTTPQDKEHSESLSGAVTLLWHLEWLMCLNSTHPPSKALELSRSGYLKPHSWECSGHCQLSSGRGPCPEDSCYSWCPLFMTSLKHIPVTSMAYGPGWSRPSDHTFLFIHFPKILIQHLLYARHQERCKGI